MMFAITSVLRNVRLVKDKCTNFSVLKSKIVANSKAPETVEDNLNCDMVSQFDKTLKNTHSIYIDVENKYTRKIQLSLGLIVETYVYTILPRTGFNGVAGDAELLKFVKLMPSSLNIFLSKVT